MDFISCSHHFFFFFSSSQASFKFTSLAFTQPKIEKKATMNIKSLQFDPFYYRNLHKPPTMCCFAWENDRRDGSASLFIYCGLLLLTTLKRMKNTFQRFFFKRPSQSPNKILLKMKFMLQWRLRVLWKCVYLNVFVEGLAMWRRILWQWTVSADGSILKCPRMWLNRVFVWIFIHHDLTKIDDCNFWVSIESSIA